MAADPVADRSRPPGLPALARCLMLGALAAAWAGQFALQYREPRMPGAWLLVGALAVLAVLHGLVGASPDDETAAEADALPTVSTRRGEWLLVSALVALGAVYRTVHFFSIPPGMNHDAAWYGMYAVQIGEGTPYTPYISAAWGRETLFMYVTALFLPLWGNTPELVQCSSTVIGVATLVPFYFLAKAMFGRRTAWVALALLAVSGWHGVFSRAGWRVITVPPAEMLALFGFWRALQTRRLRYWIVLGLGCGLAMNTYNAGRIVPPMMALLGGVWFMGPAEPGRRRVREVLRGGVVAAAVFFVTAGPMLWYAAHHWQQWQGRAEHFKELPADEVRTWTKLLDAAGMFNVRGNGNDFFIDEPLLEPMAGALFGFGLLVALGRMRRRENALLLAGLACATVPGLLSLPNGNRCITTLPFVYLIAAQGLVVLAAGVARISASPPRRRRLATALAIGALAVAGFDTYDEFLGPRRRPLVGVSPGATAAGEFARRFAGGYRLFVVAGNWPEYTLTFLSYAGEGEPLERRFVWEHSFREIAPSIDRFGDRGLLVLLDLDPPGEEALRRLRSLFPVHRVEDIRARRMDNAVVGKAFFVERAALRTTGPWSNPTRALLVHGSRGGAPRAGALRCFPPIGAADGVSARVQVMLPAPGAPARIGEVRWWSECPPTPSSQPLFSFTVDDAGIALAADGAVPLVPRERMDAGRWTELYASASVATRSVEATTADSAARVSVPLAADATAPPRLAGVEVVADAADRAEGSFYIDDVAVIGGRRPPDDARWRWSADQWAGEQQQTGSREPLAFLESFETMRFGAMHGNENWQQVFGPVLVAGGPTEWHLPAEQPTGTGTNAFDDPRPDDPESLGDPLGVACDDHGNIYVADRLRHRICKFAPDGRGLAAWGRRGSGPGEFEEPHDVFVDGGFVYVADTWNQRIQVLDENGNFLYAIQEEPSVNGPRGLFARDGLIYLTDSGNSVVRVFDRSGRFRRTVGTALGADPGHLLEPIDAVADSAGRIYVVNSGNSRIEVFDAEGKPAGIIRVSGWAGSQIKQSYLAVDDADRIYLSDSESGRVRRFATDGTEGPSLGSAVPQPGGLARCERRLLLSLRGAHRLQAFPLD